MLRIIGRALRTGQVTYSEAILQGPAPAATKGRPALDPSRCDANGACQAACPTTAIRLGVEEPDGRRLFILDYGACVFCSRCAAACPTGALAMTPDCNLAAPERADLVLRTSVPVRVEREAVTHA